MQQMTRYLVGVPPSQVRLGLGDAGDLLHLVLTLKGQAGWVWDMTHLGAHEHCIGCE